MKERLQKDFDNSIKNLSLSQKDIEIKKFCLDNFIEKGFPNRKEEDWKFSDLNQIIKNNIGELSFYNDQAFTNSLRLINYFYLVFFFIIKINFFNSTINKNYFIMF